MRAHLPEEQGRWTEDGWSRAGDVASIDPEGYVKIVHRTKGLVESGGEWISSVQLETALMDHSAVKEAAVIAVPHSKWQQRPLAVGVFKDGASATCACLWAFLESKFAKWQLPDAFFFAAEIPHTLTERMLKAKLREQFEDWKWEQ